MKSNIIDEVKFNKANKDNKFIYVAYGTINGNKVVLSVGYNLDYCIRMCIDHYIMSSSTEITNIKRYEQNSTKVQKIFDVSELKIEEVLINKLIGSKFYNQLRAIKYNFGDNIMYHLQELKKQFTLDVLLPKELDNL